MKLQYSQKKALDVQYLIMEGDLIGDEEGAKIVDLVHLSLNEGIKRVVIDLKNLRYMSSSGLGLLITLLTKIKNVGGDLELMDPSEHVKKLLIITKLNEVFNIVHSSTE